MPNPIVDPTLWADYITGDTPPPRWNGTVYEFLSFVFPESNIAGLDYIGPFPLGAFQVLVSQLSGDNLTFRVSTDDADTDYPLVSGTPLTVNIPSTAEMLELRIIDQKSSHPYALDVTIGEPVQPVAKCDELGRTTRQYVSGYTLSRQSVTRVRRMAKRCVVANFNGALTKGRTIASVRWETTSPWSLYMSNARIAAGGRESMVDVTFNFAGWGGLLCTATLDNGEIYNCEFSFTVIDSPLYPSATYDTNNGPYRLDATA